jgi:hypothetical protein
MKYTSYALLLLGVASFSCKDVPAKVYCQGFIVKETVHSADHEQLSVEYALHCNGECPNGVSCKKEKVYDPPQANGLVKIEWCGCNDTPDACDIVLKTYNTGGREIKQADCTAWDTCPTDADSCVQNPSRSRIDTVFNSDKTVKEFHYTDTLSCDCIARK